MEQKISLKKLKNIILDNMHIEYNKRDENKYEIYELNYII